LIGPNEVHHYQHRAEEADDRLISVEFSQGQSGKIGTTVKAYGPTVESAIEKATDAFAQARNYISDELSRV